MNSNTKPIVYSCSGCSSLAQLAYDISSSLDSDGIAEMSCLSGVYGEIEPVEKLTQSGRSIIAIDGCHLGCTKAALAKCELVPDVYFDLSQYGFSKREREDFSMRENSIAINDVYKSLREAGFNFD